MTMMVKVTVIFWVITTTIGCKTWIIVLYCMIMYPSPNKITIAVKDKQLHAF